MNVDRLRELTNRSRLAKVALYPAIKIRQFGLRRKQLWQKEIIANLGEMLASDPIIRLDEFGGEFAVDTHSALFSTVVYTKSYEPQLAAICKRYLDRSRDAIDVGANIGFYTVLLAKSLGLHRVLAIEPTSNAIRRLSQNVERNGVSNQVEIFEGVASNYIGEATIKTILGKEEYSSIGNMGHPEIANLPWQTETVASTTLDELVAERNLDPGFIKIDVEGAEHLVFQGAHKVLSINRPIILSELSDLLLRKNGSSSNEVISLLKSYDYDVIDPIHSTIQLGTKAFGDILCLPKESLSNHTYKGAR